MLAEESPFYPIAKERLLLESDGAVAFLDQFPVAKGHALVVPKRVVPVLFDLEPLEQAAVWDTVRLVRALLREQFDPAGFNIGINDGLAAGQTMMHAHIHLIPRYQGDCEDPRGGIRWIVPAKAVYWRSV